MFHVFYITQPKHFRDFDNRPKLITKWWNCGCQLSSIDLNILEFVLEFVNTAVLTKLRTKFISYSIVIVIKVLDNK